VPDANGAAGARNAVVCGSIEHKLGIHGNSTYTINFDGATGWLLGAANKGLAGMFVQMNHMRVLVGVIAIGLMEAAYQKALAYAKERLQGRVAGARSRVEDCNGALLLPAAAATDSSVVCRNPGGIARFDGAGNRSVLTVPVGRRHGGTGPGGQCPARGGKLGGHGVQSHRHRSVPKYGW